ncbi:MAG: glycosyltransferase [Candidatus Bathyarchaeota archaeon]|nr:glycosyltransferase [Candidatus Bathyarchaeota archaeon]
MVDLNQKGFTNTPLVSVVVPTFNSEETLEACLQSVENQTYPNLEIIVVDRYSSDSTLGIAKKFNAKVYLVSSERSAAKNYGAAKAHGSFLLFLDSDMELTPKVVEECVNVCLSKDVDAVVIPQLSVATGFLAECRKVERSMLIGDRLFEIPRFFKKGLFLKTGGFDKGLILGEDADLRLRMERAGFKVAKIKAEIKHYEGIISFTIIALKALYYGKSLPFFIRKNPSLAMKRANPARFIYSRNMKLLFKHPASLLGLIFIKLVEYIAYFIGILTTMLGLI